MSSSPTPEARIGEWLGILGTLAAAVAWCAARLRAWARSRARAASVREARDRYYHAAADAVRLLMLNAYGVGEERPSYEKIQEAAAVSLHELQSSRRALWRAEGHPDPAEDEAGAEAARVLLRELRRARQTQEFRAVDDDRPQDVIREGDTE